MIYPNRNGRKPPARPSVFILIAPSRAVEEDLSQCFSGKVSLTNADRPDFLIHECLVRDSLKGWGDYQAWLEAESRQISNRVLTLDILEKGSGGQSRNISFSAEDRQRLKQLDYYITDMLVILQTMANLINRIGRSCKQNCQVCCSTAAPCSCNEKIEEFEEYTAEAKTYLDRAVWLKERVRSTEQLYLHLSDLLAYEEAAALTQLAHASRTESQEMVKLAAQNARDAAAVKVLTIIGLVYLPTTIVSVQFVHLNDQGDLQISRQVWILAVVAIPLTILTVFTWWLCDRYNVIEALLGRRFDDSNLASGNRHGHAGEEGPSWSSSIALSTIASSQSRRSAPIHT
ncbi:uncharacterized protein ACLA_072840 [Aspergillus clavatus NRRL 1]|uniref:Uncharacterized protein n=1 Tax=Aspergillus clavatus (strain ATCC 1007 / CBS 513.65 / DSM 816 / NCTC 3887 / NRRL 1 / QM 1276 / 107) TaxID=344612 RepID=A1C780_ASPCL|nr:uncharacterized protein ACLA_072840 [Aspergillus clavatus NRRL 1]EAW14251.1 hypothetical protein ACLA_072840 [Aspergillus clavatus NRRL 1]